MAPKPFNPPRPTTSNTTSAYPTTKSRGRPKGTTTTSTTPKPTSISKSKPSKPVKPAKSRASTGTSATSNRYAALPSLSPETRRELEGSDEDDDEEDELEEDTGNRSRGGNKKGKGKAVAVDSDEDEDMEDGEGEAERIPSSQRSDDSLPSVPRPSHPTTKRRKSTTALDSDDDHENTIPPALLKVIMSTHFRHPTTRVKTDAQDAIAAYMEIFVREAVARARFEGEERRAGAEGGVLEVEDLERLAPQLVLDF